jgi:hypothetical protein
VVEGCLNGARSQPEAEEAGPMKLAKALIVMTLSTGLTGVALAQEAQPASPPRATAAPAGGSNADENTTYKAKTVYDFEDDMVEGDLQRPDGELIDSVRKAKHSSLIEIRKDFIPEMLKSLEDV